MKIKTNGKNKMKIKTNGKNKMKIKTNGKNKEEQMDKTRRSRRLRRLVYRKVWFQQAPNFSNAEWGGVGWLAARGSGVRGWPRFFFGDPFLFCFFVLFIFCLFFVFFLEKKRKKNKKKNKQKKHKKNKKNTVQKFRQPARPKKNTPQKLPQTVPQKIVGW